MMASHPGSVVVQSYNCSLFFVIFCNILNKISEIMGTMMKSRTVVKIGLLTNNLLIDDISWNRLTSINGKWQYNKLLICDEKLIRSDIQAFQFVDVFI
jgi:hypothetical protein